MSKSRRAKRQRNQAQQELPAGSAPIREIPVPPEEQHDPESEELHDPEQEEQHDPESEDPCDPEPEEQQDPESEELHDPEPEEQPPGLTLSGDELEAALAERERIGYLRGLKETIEATWVETENPSPQSLRVMARMGIPVDNPELSPFSGRKSVWDPIY